VSQAAFSGKSSQAMALHSGAFDPALERLRALRLAGREVVALARQALLLHRDVTRIYPEQASVGEDVVVLLHGLFATAGVLRPMKRRIETEALAHTASFSYVPGPGVERISERLAELVAELPAGVRIHLVGHSMGGVVMRWFVHELGGDPRIVQTISLGSPFYGTRHARLMPSRCGRDIVPHSALLARLRRKADPELGIPHLSIAAADDSVITESALWPYGEHMIIEDCGHNGLLFQPAVTTEIVRRVRGLRAVALVESVA